MLCCYPFIVLVVAVSALLCGCAAAPSGAPNQGELPPTTRSLAVSDHYAVVRAGEGETFHSLARSYYRDTSLAWAIAEANAHVDLRPGQVVAIPMRPGNLAGMRGNRMQKIPVFAYHRFGNSPAALTVTTSLFRQQMEYLRNGGYRVVSLDDLLSFMRGVKPLPPKAVVLTVDDGYRSFYEIAYPILLEYGYPATLFVYTDYINKGGVRWRELEEMVASGLVSVQPHSKTHVNLAVFQAGEAAHEYEQRIEQEIAKPTALLSGRLSKPMHYYAYPFGDTNSHVIERLRAHDYQLGLTVSRGGNSAFSAPFMLRRSMVFGDAAMEGFVGSLQTSEKVDVR